MKIDSRDMFSDPRFADHRAPMTRLQAIRNGILIGVIVGGLVAIDILLINAVLF